MKMKIIATNKKAYHDFFIENTIECGIVLEGCEVKSIRNGHVSLNDSFVSISYNNEAFIKNMYIKQYEKTSSFIPNERRDRKLLLSKLEIKKLHTKVKEKGYTIVPTKIYFKDQLVKCEIALAKGKHTYDKKQVLAQKDVQRDLQRQLKNF
jgi:SsrA-binding protein